MPEALRAAGAPVIAVSPYVGGAVVKGPTDSFMAAVGRPEGSAGVAGLYGGLIAGMLIDDGDPGPAPEGIEALSCPTLMEGSGGRRALAIATLDFAASIRAAA
jgi:LPPG:FO 2-phospho-L-lactate transferase